MFGAPDRARNAFTQIMAIAGQALPPAVLLSYGYLAANSGYTTADAKRTFWKTVTNLGVVWGMFSVVVIVAGATALHNVYTGSGPTHLGVSHYSQIETIPVAGQVLGPAFPGVLGFLAPRFFSMGLIAAAFTTLISVSLTMTYFCLDIARRNWHFTDDNQAFKVVFATWIAVPALVAPFWQLPALLKAILAMVGNLLMAPLAVAIILYFINRPALGEFRANAGRNAVLVLTFLFALGPRGERTAMTTATMTRADVVRRIEATGVVAVVRLTDPGVGEQVAQALMTGGVDAIEITMTVPRAAELIATLVAALPAALIGAGTVTDADTARAVIDAGAKFVVSPVFRAERDRSVSRARRAGDARGASRRPRFCRRGKWARMS